MSASFSSSSPPESEHLTAPSPTPSRPSDRPSQIGRVEIVQLQPSSSTISKNSESNISSSACSASAIRWQAWKTCQRGSAADDHVLLRPRKSSFCPRMAARSERVVSEAGRTETLRVKRALVRHHRLATSGTPALLGDFGVDVLELKAVDQLARQQFGVAVARTKMRRSVGATRPRCACRGSPRPDCGRPFAPRPTGTTGGLTPLDAQNLLQVLNIGQLIAAHVVPAGRALAESTPPTRWFFHGARSPA